MFACEMLPKCLVRVQTAIQCSAIYTAIQILEFVKFFLKFPIFTKILFGV